MENLDHFLHYTFFFRELLPKLKNLLEESAQTSYLKDKGSAYRYSQQYKFQLEVLTLIPKILYNLDVDEIVIDDVISSVKPYLSDKQPQPLQVIFLKMSFVWSLKLLFFFRLLL